MVRFCFVWFGLFVCLSVCLLVCLFACLFVFLLAFVIVWFGLVYGLGSFFARCRFVVVVVVVNLKNVAVDANFRY